ncbi:AAA family ATPase [Mesorhizobium sp. M0772]|uniref:AAA family ATPase n=1 Tax=Mesorhizobium sp. M0772 TaxID=2956998 RepID=UPI0033359F47
MDFSVVAPSRGTPNSTTTVVLQQDRWDDFGFKTQYHIFYYGSGEEVFIGNVKILRRGQTTSIASILPVGPLAPLSEEFCSLGQSLDYYERLASIPKDHRDEITSFLRDSVATPDHAKLFENEEGWRTSITRDLDTASYVPLAQMLLERDYSALPSVGLALTFSLAGWSAPLELHFEAPTDDSTYFAKTGKLPERVAVVTGRNGSGKSTLLARLARVIHASQAERAGDLISRLGTIEPVGIGFSRIIAVAYSAFDTFQVPGVSPQDKRQIVSDLRSGTGRYVFSGLRDIARELEERLDEEAARQGPGPDDPFALDRQDRTYLKSADQLADEYANIINLIMNSDRWRLLDRVLKLLLTDPSFSDVLNQSPDALLGDDRRATFMTWSTGHKIVLHTIATLVAYTQPKAIVLIDEPESHLHPPLLATLMHAVRIILVRNDSFAVVATHSPVVAQETLGRHVSVINHSGDVVTIMPSRIETYGESIGEITDEVFGLNAGSADFHQTLRTLVERKLTLADIEKLFDRG